MGKRGSGRIVNVRKFLNIKGHESHGSIIAYVTMPDEELLNEGYSKLSFSDCGRTVDFQINPYSGSELRNVMRKLRIMRETIEALEKNIPIAFAANRRVSAERDRRRKEREKQERAI